MEPEDELDTLLAQRHAAGADAGHSVTPAHYGQDPLSEPLGELLEAADQFAVWGMADPSPTFARRLEADLLTRFAAHSQPGVAGSARASAKIGSAADDSATPLMPVIPAARVDSRNTVVRRTPRTLQWAAVAALAPIVSASVLGAAAARAVPGQPLYGLRRLESGIVPVSTADNAIGSARQRLHSAQQALTAFNTAVARHEDSAAIDTALGTFAQQEQAAVTSIQNLQTGGVRDALATQLATLQQSARQDLRSALPSLSWATRAHITTVLGQLGDRIPQVAQAGITGVTINGNYIWIITIDGSDFSSTALVLIDGQPVGTIVTRSSTTIVAHVPGNDLSAGSHVLGVGNPDDTASMLSGVSSAGTQDDHGGSSGSGSSKDGSGDSGGGGHGGG